MKQVFTINGYARFLLWLVMSILQWENMMKQEVYLNTIDVSINDFWKRQNHSIIHTHICMKRILTKLFDFFQKHKRIYQ